MAVTEIGKMYYKGVTEAQTQEVTRAVSDEISQSVQLGAGTVTPTPSIATTAPMYICVGNTRYSYVLDKRISSTQHALWADKVNDCANTAHAAVNINVSNPTDAIGSGGHELLGQNMRLRNLILTQPNPATAPTLYNLSIGIIYGEDDVLNSAHTQCINNSASLQFCAVVNTSTSIKKRL